MQIIKYIAAVPRSRLFKYYNNTSSSGGSGGGGTTYINVDDDGIEMYELTINDVGSGQFITDIDVNADDPQVLDVTRSDSSGGVDQLIAGQNITLDPANGKGVITVSSTGGGGISNVTYNKDYATSGPINILTASGTVSGNTYMAAYKQLISGDNITIKTSPIDGAIIISAEGGGGGGITFVKTGTGWFVADLSYNSTTSTLTGTMGDVNYLDFKITGSKIIGGVAPNVSATSYAEHSSYSGYVLSGNAQVSLGLYLNSTKISAFNGSTANNIVKLYLNSNTGITGMNNYVAINETGSIYQTMNGNNMKVSDREVFQNFTPVENSDLIYQLNPVQGYSIDDTQPQKDLKYVIFATEVRNYFPSLTESVVLDATNLRIDKNGNTMSRLEFVDYVQFIPLMIAEMKNLKNQISQLQATINQMNSTPIEE